MKKFLLTGIVLGAGLASCGEHGGNDFDGFVDVNGEPYDPDPVAFCDSDPVRSDVRLTFSEPLQIESGYLYEISISADFENFETEFEYPNPLICTLSEAASGRVFDCPDFTPTDTEFRFDGVPRWTYNEAEEISGFHWYRIVSTASVVLSRNGSELFNGTVEFTTTTSECPGHVFEGFPDHPEYGETYRYAVGDIDTSE